MLIATCAIALVGCKACKDEPPKPDTNFDYYLTTDSTVVNPSVITINDKITFKSNAKIVNVVGYTQSFVLYTGFGYNKYQPNFDMKTNKQSDKGTGLILKYASVDDVPKYTNYSFTEAGVYKLVYVSRVFEVKGGEYEEKIDSSKTITVINPDASKAELFAFPIPYATTVEGRTINESGKWWPNAGEVSVKLEGNIINVYYDDQSTIVADMFNPAATKKYYFLLNSYSATSKEVYIDGNIIGNGAVAMNDGSIVKVVSIDKTKETTYTVKYNKLVPPPVVKNKYTYVQSVNVTNVKDGYVFAAVAVVDTAKKTITLPQLPYGTTTVAMTVTLALKGTYSFGGKDNAVIDNYDVTSNKKIIVTSEDGDFTAVYSISKSTLADQKSTIDSVGVISKTPSILKYVSPNYKLAVADSSGLKDLSFVLKKESYTKVSVKTGVDSTFVPYVDKKNIDCKNVDTLYFKSINGTDSSLFNISIDVF